MYCCCFKSLYSINWNKIDKSTGFKPRSKVWLICLRRNLQQNKIDNVLTPSYATNKVRVTNLGVRNHVVNCVYNLRETLQQMKIDNVFTAWYATNKVLVSSVKQSGPGRFLKSSRQFFLSFLCTFFYKFLIPKNYKSTV